MIRSMKDSRIKWIGEIPENWRIEKLKFHIRVRNEKQAGLGLTYIALENIVGFDCRYIATDHQYSGDDANIARENDIIFSKLRPYLGKVYKVQSDAYVNTEFVVCQAISISDNYLKWYMISHGFLDIVNSSTYGAKMPRANSDYIKNLQVLLPPIAEQKKIADFLDGKCAEIDELVQTEEKMIEELKAYKQSVITEAVTKGLNPSAPMKDSGIEWIGKIPASWEVKKLKQFCDGALKYGANANGIAYRPDLARYVRITDILDNRLRDDILKQSLPNEIANDYILQDNDILFARSGGTVGKTFIFDASKYGKCAFAGYLIRARISAENIAKYVYYYTLGTCYNEWKNRIFIQSTIQNIGASKYSMLDITVPSLDEQKQIADYLDEKCAKIDEIIALRTEQINQLKEYKKSLIYEYVTGKKEVV